MSVPVPGEAIRMRGMSQFRRRWRSWLGLALLVGLAGGFVIACVAGARRTTSAYDRLLESARPFDVVLGVGCDDPDQAECPTEAAAAIDDILALPQVADGAQAMTFLPAIIDDRGFSIQPQEEALGRSGEAPGATCVTGNGSVSVEGSVGNRLGTDINRYRFVEGRAADPARADEAVLSLATARRANIHVGDMLHIVPFHACDDDRPVENWPDPFDVTIVGLHVAPGEVQPETGHYLQSVTVTPPLLDRLVQQLGNPQPGVMVLLQEGATVPELTSAVERAGIRASIDLTQEAFSADVRRGLQPDAFALQLLAVLGGAVALVVLGQALLRQAWGGADDLQALRALGFTRRDLVAAGCVEGAIACVVGATIAGSVAIVASPLFPIGRAQLAEPTPGIRIDAFTVAAGAVLVVVLSLVGIAIGSRRVAAVTTAPTQAAPRAPSLPPFLARLGAGPTAIVGARMAVDRGHGARSVPVRSGFTAIAVGAAALVGSLTFAADLDHLIQSPHLVGWNWDTGFIGGIEPTNAAPDADPVTGADEVVRHALEVEGVARAGYMTLFPASDTPLIKTIPDLWPVGISTGPGSIKPTVIRGRAPASPDEILVTPTVLHELDLEIGDSLEVQGVKETEAGDAVLSPAVVTIVGTGVAPIGDGLFEHTVVLTFDGLRTLAPRLEPQLAVVDFTPGADRARATTALIGTGMLGPIDTDMINVTALVDLDVRTADTVPRLLGALMAALSIGVLMHLVYAGVRAGRRDIATLRVLGFRRRQVIGAVAWQTVILVGVPLAAGTIIGAIAGRAVWLIYADRLGVAPDAVVAWGAIIEVFVAFMFAANAFGVAVGRRAHTRSPAEQLRAE